VSGAGPDVKSLQWICLAGTAALRIGEGSRDFGQGAQVVVDSGRMFHLSNPGDASLVFLEIWAGSTEIFEYLN